MITFGITSFERPWALRRLINSIDEHYQQQYSIIVADNSRHAPKVPSHVNMLPLPFDSGLSACRNAIMRQADTEYVLVLEDDFVFTSKTNIDVLLNTMQSLSVHGVNIVSGAVQSKKDVIDGWLYSMKRQNGHLVMTKGPTGRIKGYITADVTVNFFLIQRQVALDHPWNESLKLGEHIAWFWEGKQKGIIRLVHRPDVLIAHRHVGNAFYNKHRKRRHFRSQWLEENGFKSIKWRKVW